MTEPPAQRTTAQPGSRDRRTFVPRDEVLAAFSTTPVLDADAFRLDADSLSNQDLIDREW